MNTASRTVTFVLDGDTPAILINALSDAARLLDGQADEQERWGRDDYARNLRGTARETRALLDQVNAAVAD